MNYATPRESPIKGAPVATGEQAKQWSPRALRTQKSSAIRRLTCGAQSELGPVLPAAFDEVFGGQNYIASKDGGEPVIETCPERGEEAYVVGKSRCAACGFEVPDDARCAVCGNALGAESYAEYGGLCSYHAY